MEKDSTIGMFMSTPISPPDNNVRGDGLCFCFRLDGYDAGCYRWVGQTKDCVEVLSSTEMQIAVCSNSYMAFGGSGKYGTNALRLNSDLMQCDTGHSDTFCNPPLVSLNDLSGGQQLQVAEVEVFCGTFRPH